MTLYKLLYDFNWKEMTLIKASRMLIEEDYTSTASAALYLSAFEAEAA